MVLGLLIVTAASFWRVAAMERRRSQLARDYAQARQLVEELEAERNTLTAQLGQAQQTVETQTADLQDARQQLQTLTEQLRVAETALASLHQEQHAWQQQKTSLATQLDATTAEKQQLAARLSSLKELKLAIREVKQTLHAHAWAAWRARRERQWAADRQQLAAGNRGYLIREGLSTLGTSVRLHVHVLEPQSQ